MENKTILLDLDGVLVNFVTPAMRAVGLDRNLVERGHWDVFRKAGCSLDEVWGKIDNYEFWSGLKPYPKAQTFLAILQEHCLNVVLCTSSSFSIECPKAKAEWVNKYLGKLPTIICYNGVSKAVQAKPGNILIDDCDRNVDAFEAAGGETILVPRPWNRLHWLGTDWDTVNYNYVLEKLGIPSRIPDSETEGSAA